MKHPAEGLFSREGSKKDVDITTSGSVAVSASEWVCAAATPPVKETRKPLGGHLRSPVFASDLPAGIIRAGSLLSRYATR